MSEDFNPYAPPRADDGVLPLAGANPADLVDASAGARMVNVIVDTAARVLFEVILKRALALAGHPVGAGVAQLLFVMTTVVVYYIGFEYFTGFTIGKLLTGTRVVDQAGGQPRFAQILGRTLARWVPLEAFSFLGSTPRGWHDTWSGTRVVKRR